MEILDLEKLKKETLEIEKELIKLKEESGENPIQKAQINKGLFLIAQINKGIKEIQETTEIINKEKDPELLALAKEEKEKLTTLVCSLNSELKNLLKKFSQFRQEHQGLIMEIRAGTGGEEAALFAADLFRMYQKYAKEKGWEIKVLDSNPTSLGGYKEIIFEVKGDSAYQNLKYEGGVHRVQRVPETEKSGRIHTSTATVVTMLKPKPKEIKINPQDLKIETFKASGPGGQYVNKRETAVRITHLPSGIVVACQSERSLGQNREQALAILQAKLLELEKRKEEAKISKERKDQIKHAERSEKIRTYNFPQNRITDHRIKKSWKNLDEVLEGKLDPIVEALKASLNSV